ncbi:CehA/McbA family metallohydrolase [Aestuariivivens insulae]|uniref:CehA/McbA family metallohydrolase n=1 Tax=Aestuariivivens insulae TaxID=1621988 RepID=UPI001F5A3B56|nr:CehA/McbA family metallohydrolase [Aestuariivivens insulae]
MGQDLKNMFLLVTCLAFQTVIGQDTKLTLNIYDESSLVPARVEIKDAMDNYFIAENTLLFGGDCSNSEEPTKLTNLKTTLGSFKKVIENPYTRTTQFYSTGESVIKLGQGTYYISIQKGLEYKVFRDTITLNANADLTYEAYLKRWINMPQENWYGADDHLHIPRPVPEIDPYILQLIQAEDIHVGNLLQIGKAEIFEHSPQYAFGLKGDYQKGNFIIASGQENPRTHFLGHAISLGINKPIHNPEKYLIYRYIWEEVKRQGGLNGFAHGNERESYILSAHKGVSLLLPDDLMHFIEVMAFNRHEYSLWYDILNLGFKVAPTAGTDFPCGDNLPGHERFYTKVEGSFNYNNWLEGIRKGRTFVTVGPMVEFEIDNQPIGSELERKAGDLIKIKGKVHLDPEQDDLNFIEIVQNGDVIFRINDVSGKGLVNFEFTHTLQTTSWIAVRGIGDRKLETLFQERGEYTIASISPKSPFHTAPIYMVIQNESNPKTKHVAQSWLDRLNNMEIMLAEKNLNILAQHIQEPNWDNVPKEILINNRDELLKEIFEAKEFFSNLIKD